MTTASNAPIEGAAPANTKAAIASAVLMVTLIGALVRIVPVLTADFPLSDGGLFVTMTRDLMDNGFALPFETTYNGAGIPFLYPPLGFYLMGAIATITGIDLITLFRFVPLIVSIATIPAVYYLAMALLPTRFGATVATIAFALIPRSFEFTIAGGGLTRGLGVLFAVLLLAVAVRLAQRSTVRRTIALGVIAALAASSHPEAVLIGALWLVVVLVVTNDRPALLRSFVGAGIVAVVGIAPWLVTINGTHGIASLLSAGSAGVNLETSWTYLLTAGLTDEAFLTLFGVLALLGLFLRSSQRDWRWILWIVGVLVVDPRGGANYLPAILGPLTAIAIVEIVLPALRWTALPHAIPWPDGSIGRGPRLALLVLLAFGVGGAIGARYGDSSPLFALSGNVRDAIAAVAAHTPADAEVVVVSGTGWWVDATAEWFPVLAERRSVSTIQGIEWRGATDWQAAVVANLTLQACAFESVACFETWLTTNAPTASYVFIPRGAPTASPLDSECCPALRVPLVDAGYPVRFDMPGGTLLEIRP